MTRRKVYGVNPELNKISKDDCPLKKLTEAVEGLIDQIAMDEYSYDILDGNIANDDIMDFINYSAELIDRVRFQCTRETIDWKFISELIGSYINEFFPNGSCYGDFENTHSVLIGAIMVDMFRQKL